MKNYLMYKENLLNNFEAISLLGHSICFPVLFSVGSG